jgi:hypothetical protein
MMTVVQAERLCVAFGLERDSEAARAALDLHEGLPAAGCPRWPDHLRLQSTLGQLVPGRCKGTNVCEYCAKLAAVENAEVLAQDALSNSAPQVWSVLTTRSTVAEMSAYARAREGVIREVKRWRPSARRATLIEFTTGMGTGSGGQRRPHWNDIWKDIAPGDVGELHERTSWAWCKRVDAQPRGQYVGVIAETGGLMRYLALHFQKESQQPPKGWRGQRFNVGRGYLSEPMEQARQRARQALRLRRELWRAEQAGLTGAAALEAAELALYEANELGWELVKLQDLPTAWGPDGLPVAWEQTAVAA